MKASINSLAGRDAFTVAEVCHRTGISKDSAYALIRTGELPARRLGKRLLVTEQDLRRFLGRLPRAGTGQAA
jgi:excisionase family DNA binding protein